MQWKRMETNRTAMEKHEAEPIGYGIEWMRLDMQKICKESRSLAMEEMRRGARGTAKEKQAGVKQSESVEWQGYAKEQHGCE